MARNWPGLGERIMERIAALGYANAAQFADAKHYRVTYVYKWISGTTPDRRNLDRLSKDLKCSPAWLLFGAGEGRIPRGALALVLALGIGAGMTSWVPADGGTQPLDFINLIRSIMSTLAGRLHRQWAAGAPWMARRHHGLVWEISFAPAG